MPNPPTTIDETKDLFKTVMVEPWLGGVNLNKALTDIAPNASARLSNFIHTSGNLVTRPGLVSQLAGLGGVVTSMRRLNLPTGDSRLFWGAGANWLRGWDAPAGDGSSEILEGGFSGDPLTMIPIRKPKMEGAWMLVADRLKMRKAGLAATPSLPIGVAAPLTAAVTALTNPQKTLAVSFDAGDGSQAVNWRTFGGSDNTGILGGAPTAADVAGTDVDGSAVAFTLVPGAATTGWRSLAVLQKAMDLSTFPNASLVTNDDLIHLQLRMSDPSNIAQVMLYFVCSPLSLTGSIPGVSTTENTAAYMHAFQPSDYEAFIGVQATGTAAASTAAGNSAVSGTPLATGQIPVRQRPQGTPVTSYAIPRAGLPSTQAAGGANTWLEFSQIGLPLRRSDFVPIGTAGKPGTDWSTITGVYIVIWTRINRALVVSFDDCYLFGGAGADSTEPGAQKFDYRYINFDSRTGARSNGSPTQATTAWIDSQRQSIQVTPVATGNSYMRQEFYRRGGSITNNWYFAGANTADGAAFVDTATDAALLAADVLPIDNYQPVATVDGGGNTILNQPVPVLIGPIADGIYIALGDPHRPGHVYSCITGNFDAWPVTPGYVVEVCAPSEELMNGCVWGGGAMVLSRERGYMIYANPGAVGIVSSTTPVVPGLACRWGFTPGPGGVFYVARDGVRITNGAESKLLSDQIRPLFNGQSLYGRLPIDFTQPTKIRLTVHNMDVWLKYLDTAGTQQHAVYSLLYHYWRFVDFQIAVGDGVYSDEDVNVAGGSGLQRLLVGGAAGAILRHDGFSDLGAPIQASMRTGASSFGEPRQEKLLGDVVIDMDPAGAATALLTTYLNAEQVINAPSLLPFAPGATGRRLMALQPFGTEPQRARSLSLELSVTAPITSSPAIYGLGIGVALEPEVTLLRVTEWNPLPGPEGFLQGVRLDVDTRGLTKSIAVEVDLAGTITTVATLSVTAGAGSGPASRHVLWFSWLPVHGTLVRLRPLDTVPWTLWKADWLTQAEPPRISAWCTNWEAPGGDRYYTGLDLECDTFGATKVVQVQVDQVVIGTYNVTRNGRGVVHITLPTGRGHVFRFDATDLNPGLLYLHTWLTTPEPGEQTNWNAGYTTWSSLSDKNLKGLIIECDTFGQTKTVTVEADGAVVVPSLQVNHTGRLVKNYAFPQVIGRVFRVIPSDSFASRPYTILPIFDEEPYSLNRWETQLLDFNLPGAGWGHVLSADLCYRATVATTLTIACYNSQGTLVTTVSVALPSTAGLKQKSYFPFPANKGVLFKFIFQTADNSPNLAVYQEESRLRVQQWAGQQVLLKNLGNDDADATRNMTNSVVAAGKPGGGS